MKVMDSEQQWVKDLPSHQHGYLAAIERDATVAYEAGKPFFDVVFNPGRSSLSSVVSVLSEVGYDYTNSIVGDRGYHTLLFKRVSN